MDTIKCEKIVLWGSGKCAKEIIQHQEGFKDVCEITDVFDSDCNCWGKQLGQYVIKSPDQFKEAEYDKVVIATSLYFQEIKEFLMEMEISDEEIENSLYFAKRKILIKYGCTDDEEIRESLEYIKNHDLEVFNYPFVEKYNSFHAVIEFDDHVGMFYVYHNGLRMYMARWLDTYEKVLNYYKSLIVEQDIASPHRYLEEGFTVSKDDNVVDAGAAEGNFAIEVLDKVSKIYLVEAESEWIEALQHTFADYQDKVVIIQGYISDCTDESQISLDDVIKEPIQFIKMDLEGEEVKALAGASRLMQESERLKCVICAYHNNEDEKRIREIAEENGLKARVTKRYMYFPYGKSEQGYEQRYYNPVFRRGVVRLEKP